MKIVLIQLPLPRLVNPNAQTPIGVMYLASIIGQYHEVVIKNYAPKSTWEAINDLPEADFYGITITVTQFPQVNRFAHLIKEKYHNAVIGLGGPGTNFDQYVDWGVTNTICIGEGENVILGMLEDLQRNNLQKIYRGSIVQDLDSLPYPARHLLGLDQSPFAFNKNYKSTGSVGVITSRGCPFSCDFCAAPKFSVKVRYRSPQSVYGEMKHIIDTYGVRQFRFIDDIFTLNKSRLIKICDLLKELDVAFRVMCRVDTFDRDIAKALKSAGCSEIEFGVESFDNDVLKLMNKQITAEDSVKALEIAQDYGLHSRLLFMIRTPGQTERTIPTNIDYLQRVPYDMLACGLFVPIPGSAIWHNPKKYGIEIIDKNLEHYEFFIHNKFDDKPYEIFRFLNRDTEEVNKEDQVFLDFMRGIGKLHMG